MLNGKPLCSICKQPMDIIGTCWMCHGNGRIRHFLFWERMCPTCTGSGKIYSCRQCRSKSIVNLKKLPTTYSAIETTRKPQTSANMREFINKLQETQKEQYKRILEGARYVHTQEQFHRINEQSIENAKRAHKQFLENSRRTQEIARQTHEQFLENSRRAQEIARRTHEQFLENARRTHEQFVENARRAQEIARKRPK